MKIVTRILALVIALGVGQVASAEAQMTPLTGHSCNYLNGPMALMGFDACSGAYGGNDNGNSAPSRSAVTDFINALWGPGFFDRGVTDEGQTAGPFSSVPDGRTGQLVFDAPITGDFVLSLKTSEAFSLYLFRDVTELAVLDYTTMGVALNSNGEPQGLSHAGIWVRVSEPATVLLLITGLLGLGLTSRRRRAHRV